MRILSIYHTFLACIVIGYTAVNLALLNISSWGYILQGLGVKIFRCQHTHLTIKTTGQWMVSTTIAVAENWVAPVRRKSIFSKGIFMWFSMWQLFGGEWYLKTTEWFWAWKLFHLKYGQWAIRLYAYLGYMASTVDPLFVYDWLLHILLIISDIESLMCWFCTSTPKTNKQKPYFYS